MNRRFIIMVLIPLTFTITLTIAIKHQAQWLLNIDNLTLQYIITKRTEVLTKLFSIITILGNIEGIVPLVSIAFIILKIIWSKQIGWIYLLSTFSSSLLVNPFIKVLIQRDRPHIDYRLVDISGFSFPSAHSMNAVVTIGLLFWLISITMDMRYKRIVCLFISSLIILLIGFSRIYLAVHYLSDVLAGFSYGLLINAIWIYYFKRHPNIFDKERTSQV